MVGISEKTRLANKKYQESRRADWDNVDWTMTNQQIATLLNRSYDTVTRKRGQLGKQGLAKATRKDKGVSKTTHIPTKQQQMHATKQAQKSPKAGKSATNIHAKKWTVVAPDGTIYKITNLYQFVRDNAHLFLAGDVAWKRVGGKRGTGGEYCNAVAGLYNVANGTSQAWKGWTIKRDDS